MSSIQLEVTRTHPITFSNNPFFSCCPSQRDRLCAKKRSATIERRAVGYPVYFRGQKFSFKSETLARYPESYFGRLVGGSWQNRAGSDGCIFIERDARPFQHIAAFLVYGKLNVSLENEDLEALLDECDYFCLDELRNLLLPRESAFQNIQ